MVIRRRLGNAAAFTSTGSYPTVAIPAETLKDRDTRAPANRDGDRWAGCGLRNFVATATVETGVNHYAVERLDHKNKKLHHCTAVLDAETRQLTGQCAEMPGFPEKPTGNGPNVEGGLSNMFGGVPVFGSWKIDQTTGKTEFCISGTAQCVEVTPP
jgi:hypothetical protein